jgi:DedD protein
MTGAAVLMVLAVIFIPMILDNSGRDDMRITETNIPPRPESDFRSPVVPLEQGTAVDTAAAEPVPPLLDAPVVTDDVPDQPVEQPEQSAIMKDDTRDTTVSEVGDAPAWVIQLGSFASKTNAQNLVEQVKKEEYPAYLEEMRGNNGTVYYRVRVGPELQRSRAEAILKDLTAKIKLQEKGIIRPHP